MNEITRKAANALVAAVDFFQGALVAEAQAGEAKQVQLDALAGQLRDQIKADEEACGLMQEEIDDLRNHRDELMGKVAVEQQEVSRLRELLEAEQGRTLELSSENSALREVAMRARVIIPLRPRTKAFDKAMSLLARDLNLLDRNA